MCGGAHAEGVEGRRPDIINVSEEWRPTLKVERRIERQGASEG